MKRLLLFTAIIFAALQTFSQTDPLRQKLDSIFQYVDKTQIPTGYLKEYGAELMPIHWFNGVLTDSNAIADIDCWRATYTDISTAKIQPQLTTMTGLTTINTTIEGLRNAQVAPIAVLYGNYASLKDDALALNLFSINNQQIYDVANRTQSPYLIKTLFTAASIDKQFTNTVTLTFAPSLYFTNTTLSLSQLAVDFKDGQGYRIIPVNGSVSKTYEDSTGTKLIDYRAQLSNGVYLYCHGSVDVFVTGGTSNRYIGNDLYAREVLVPVVPGEGLGGDIMQIRYSMNNPTRSNSTPRLRKPLIYVEGYDVSGKYDIYSLLRNDLDKPGEWVELFNNTGYDFMQNLDDIAGYDLVFVNYNTLRSFEDNTKMLQHVIEWVKQDKTAGGYTEQNVIIGTSAGGILARYTLARMTKTISPESTDTRLLITHDSPHQGANVPLAFQHFLYDLGFSTILGMPIKENFEDLKNFFKLNLEPATAQLLRARVTDENGTVAINTFLNGLNSPYQQMITFPPTGGNRPLYRFIATAQGSQCGVPVMPSNSLPLANYDGDFSIVKFRQLFLPTPYASKYSLKTQLTALPANGLQSQIENFKLTRRFSFWGVGFGTKAVTDESWPNPVGFTEWDAKPGSTQSINDRTGGALTKGLTKQKLPWFLTPYIKINAGLNMNITQDLFSFISTTSALDAPVGTAANTPYIFSNTGTSGTSSQKYIAQENFNSGGVALFNQNHTTYTARNAAWIFSEMENSAFVDCASTCNPLSISGNDRLCSNENYTIDNLITGSTITWSATPAGIVSISNPNSTQSTLNFVSTGTVSLIATIINPCNQTTVISKTIQVGGNGYQMQIYGSNYVQCGDYVSYQVANAAGLAYNWTFPSDWNYAQGQGSSVLYVQLPYYGASSGDVNVTVYDGCNYYYSSLYVQANCGGYYYTVGPNPSSSTVTVSAKETTTKGERIDKNITELNIYDKLGNLKKRQKFNRLKRATIDVSDLKQDIYILEIVDGNFRERQQLSIIK